MEEREGMKNLFPSAAARLRSAHCRKPHGSRGGTGGSGRRDARAHALRLESRNGLIPKRVGIDSLKAVVLMVFLDCL